MSKRTTTRLYFGAFVVWLVAFAAFVMLAVANRQMSSPPPLAIGAMAVMGLAGIVMLVAWIGALVRLGQQSAWGWFVAVLLLHLIGLGIVGMIAYAAAGPADEPAAPVPAPTIA